MGKEALGSLKNLPTIMTCTHTADLHTRRRSREPRISYRHSILADSLFLSIINPVRH